MRAKIEVFIFGCITGTILGLLVHNIQVSNHGRYFVKHQDIRTAYSTEYVYQERMFWRDRLVRGCRGLSKANREVERLNRERNDD